MRAHFDGFPAPRDGLNGTSAVLPVRPIDVARAIATTCGPAPALDPLRRLLRFGGYVLETMAHLGSSDAGALQVLGLQGLDPTARSELSQRLGVGMARVVAERDEIGLVDLYAFDRLSRASAAPRIVRRSGSGQRPDYVGSLTSGGWIVLEAKGRTARGPLTGTRRKAHSQAQAVGFFDTLGRRCPVELRVGSVARLGPGGVDVWFEDPDSVELDRVYVADPDELLMAYYQPARDLLSVYGRLRPVSGAASFGAAPLPQTGTSLLVHARVAEALDDPDLLRAARAEIVREVAEEQAFAVAEDAREISLGRDGLGLLLDLDPIDLADWIRDLRRT